MTEEAFVSGLKTLMLRAPFTPFVIELHNGRRLEVDHQLAVALSPEGLAIFNGPGPMPIYFDRESVVGFIDAPAHASRPRKPKR